MDARLANSSVFVACVAAIGIICALPSVADFDLNTAVSVWHMDEGEGAVAKDSGPSGNDGAFWRNPVWVDGRFGKALQLDGQAFVWIKDAAGVPLGTSPRTVMCHFKWAEINDFANIIPTVNDAEVFICLGPRNWRQRVSLQIHSEGGIGVDTFDDREMFDWNADTEWHHVAAVFPEGATSSDQFLLYFDGALQETSMDADVNAINSGGGEIVIGCITGKLTDCFNGTIDEAAVFPFAMAAEDVASVARKGLVRGQFLDVSPNGKLTTSWASLKEL